MEFEVDMLRAMVSALPDPVFVLTESGRYASIAGGQDATYYHDGSHLQGLFLKDVLPEHKADWFLEQIHQTLAENCLRTVEYSLAGKEVEGLDTSRGPSGDIYFEGRVQPLAVRYRGERAVVWVARNISRRHDLEEELRHLSETDALTGVYNRRKLMAELDERFREFRRYSREAALIMFDIDHFKTINDRFGHAAGDEVLCRIARVCSSTLRDVDLFCRVGGEEFACLLPETDQREAKRVASRLREAIAEEVMRFGQNEVSVTVSAGVGRFMEADETPDSLIRRADDALYAAKRGGRDQVIIAAD